MKEKKTEKERKEARAEAVRRATKKYQAKMNRVTVYVNDEEYHSLDKAAKSENVTIGRFVREAAAKQAKRVTKKAKKKEDLR